MYCIYRYIFMAYSFYPHPWIPTSFPQVGPNPKWFVCSVKVDQLSHMETKSVVRRCIVWYLKNLLHPRNLKSLPLKNDGWNSSFCFWIVYFQGLLLLVSGRVLLASVHRQSLAVDCLKSPNLYLAVRLYYPVVTPAPTSPCFGRSLLSEAQHSWVESQK